MKLFPSLFQKNENLNPYQEFWKWFSKNSDYFYKIVNSGKNIEENFFDKLTPELQKISDEIYFLTGMADSQTAELIFTPDGIIKKIYIVEELVATAPELSNWKFTALKPESKNSQFNLEMFGYTFGTDTMQFYYEPNSEYPDEINITLIHKDYKEENNGDFLHASYIFLDNYLGELNTVTQIDELKITDSIPNSNQSVPLTKLKEYLIWREKEFTEKYEGFWHNTENDSYSSFEATLNNGRPLIAIINTSLLAWDSKASHPWIFRIEIDFEGDENGLPNQKTFEILNELEDDIMKQLKDSEGYLNIGRETADNCRDIFFACKEFRKPPKVLDEIIKNNTRKLKIDYKIYKDKYWASMKRFEINS